MGAAETVRVTFVDAATGTVIGTSQVPPDQLPPTFDTRTTLDLAGTTWSIERADPPTAAEFSTTGELTLTMSQVKLIDPRTVLYSLPTICADLPPTGTPTTDRFELHEDDWRQLELVEARHQDIVEAQFEAIRQVYAEANRNPAGPALGFPTIHARDHPTHPLRVPLAALPPGRPFPGGVGFHTQPESVTNSFAIDLGSFTLYGLAAGPHATVLALSTVPVAMPPALREFMRVHDVALVDWCGMTSSAA